MKFRLWLSRKLNYLFYVTLGSHTEEVFQASDGTLTRLYLNEKRSEVSHFVIEKRPGDPRYRLLYSYPTWSLTPTSYEWSRLQELATLEDRSGIPRKIFCGPMRKRVDYDFHRDVFFVFFDGENFGVSRRSIVEISDHIRAMEQV